jgi:uncharacterized membrane protein
MISSVLISVALAAAILAAFAIPTIAAQSASSLGVADESHGGSAARKLAVRICWLVLVAAGLAAIALVLVRAPWWVPPTAATGGGILALSVSRGLLLRARKDRTPADAPRGQERISSAGPPPTSPLPLGRFASAYAISLAIILCGAVAWDAIPASVPIHWGATGAADAFAAKNLLTAFAGAWVGLFLTTVLLAAALASARRTYRLVAGGNEELGREQESVDQWASQNTFAAVAVVLSVATSLLSLLSWVEGVPSVVVVVVSIAMLAALLLVGLGYQVARRARRSAIPAWSDGAGDDNAYWIAGLIYVNRGDSATIVPKRVGIGWTLNLGRPVPLISVVTCVALLFATTVFALIHSLPR